MYAFLAVEYLVGIIMEILRRSYVGWVRIMKCGYPRRLVLGHPGWSNIRGFQGKRLPSSGYKISWVTRYKRRTQKSWKSSVNQGVSISQLIRAEAVITGGRLTITNSGRMAVARIFPGFK